MNDYGNGYDNGAGFGFLFVFIGIAIYLVVLVGVYVLFAWMLSRVFQKAGVERWKAWVPIYNTWVLLEMGGQMGWISILGFIPVVNIVAVIFLCIAIYHLNAGFGKPGAGWLVLFIFLPLVWLIVQAFDSSYWDPRRMQVPPIFGANVPYRPAA